MVGLPDPRGFPGTAEPDLLLDLTRQTVAAEVLARPARVLALRQALESLLEKGEEQRLRAALGHVPDATHYRALWHALAQCIDAPLSARTGIIARAFALPLVLITSSAHGLRIPGQLTDAGALQALFEHSHALGPTRNFGLSNALCSLDALEALSALAVFRAVRSLEPQSIGASLAPEDIVVEARREQVHVRFVVGAAIGAADSPGFAETAANIGAWGRECAKLVTAQLAAPGLQLLALPRPPRDLISAAHAGRFAQLEVALNLFASNNVRRFRTAVGDPVVIVSAHDGGEVRVSLSSPFAQDVLEGFRWPLHPLDDLREIQRLILNLFEDMRVGDVRLVPTLLPPTRDNGATFYPRCDDWDALVSAAVRH